MKGENYNFIPEECSLSCVQLQNQMYQDVGILPYSALISSNEFHYEVT